MTYNDHHLMPDQTSSVSTPKFDLIVIGAGINGAGIARDAASRGLKVLLIDKGDVGSGTSSWSTRLIHGGLRYLEHGEFGLVRESLHERETLLRIAPHLIRPLPIAIPIYKDSKRGPVTIRAGMIAYDLLSVGKTLPRHRMYSTEETTRKIPGLNKNNLAGSAVYFDAQVEFAERLVLENVLAARESGAEIVTYARVSGLSTAGGRVSEVEFVCEDSNQRLSARPEIVINAAGPWIDQLLERVSKTNQQLIGGTKGSHIVVPEFPGAPELAVYIEAQSDRRPFFVIPWNGSYLIGTTEVRFDEDPDEARSEGWEIDYLIMETNRAFPDASLTRDRILYTYSGVRPLPFTDVKDEQKITRRHFIREHPELNNLFSIVGGKLTTYRSLAEECVNLVFHRLGRRSPSCSTELPLPGAVEPSSFVADPFEKLSAKVRVRLARIYGTRAIKIIELCTQEPSLSQPFNNEGDAIAAEVVFSFESELAKTLSDCLLRRTMLGLNADLGIGNDVAVAEIAKRFLGWSVARTEREVAAYRQYVKRFIVPVV
jgi:glycerol-3-phosphate dehydrogenase